MVVTLGALLADVPHSRPVSVVGTSYDPTVVERLDLQQSRYEGPTGIVGVLQRRVPAGRSRVGVAVGDRADLRVRRAVTQGDARARRAHRALLGVFVPTTDLEIATAAYERQVSELVAADDETRDYVETLEHRYDEGDDHTGVSLIEEVERFLRERPE